MSCEDLVIAQVCGRTMAFNDESGLRVMTIYYVVGQNYVVG